MTVADALAVPPNPVQARLNMLGLVSATEDSLPEVALAPDHWPEAVQKVALVDDQVSVDDPPLVTDVGFAVMDTLGTGDGGPVPDAVVKLEVKWSASPLPAASFASGEMIAVYCVLAARGADGVNVAVLPLTLTVPVTAERPVVVTSVKLAVVSVELVIGSENVADTGESSATPVAPFTGEVADTVGGVVSRTAAVVKVELKMAANALPAASFAAVVMVAVYSVPAARAADGVNVAVLPLMFTPPLIAALPEVVIRVKLAVVNVALVIGLEKVADIEEFSATPVATLAGAVADTVGGVVSGTAPVVKFQVKLAANGLPAESFAPVVMVAVYGVLAARGVEGVKVAVLLLTLTVPVIGTPACVVSVKVSVLSVEFNIVLEKFTVMVEFTAMLIAAFVGEVEETIGGVVSVTSVVATATFDWPEKFPDESKA